MCTLVILRRPGHLVPLAIAANRDERLSRPALAPANHWPSAPIIAGLDQLAGGTWLGINRTGFAVAMLNRDGQLGPEQGKLSRGVLAIEMLSARHLQQALDLLTPIKLAQFRAFNSVIADICHAYWLKWDGEQLTITAIKAGLHMLASGDLNEDRHGRINYHLPLWRAAKAPDLNSWGDWPNLLASRAHAPEDTALGAMCIETDFDYGTVSSSLIAWNQDAGVRWQFAPGAPDRTVFDDIPLQW